MLSSLTTNLPLNRMTYKLASHASTCSFKCQSIAVQRSLLGWVISVACYVNSHGSYLTAEMYEDF